MNILKRILALYGWIPDDSAPSREEITAVFRTKYTAFKELLESNTELLRIVTDLEDKLHGASIFGMSYIRSQSSRAMFHAMRMVKAFDTLSNHGCPALFEAVDRVGGAVKDALETRRETPMASIVLEYEDITRDMVDFVGGKSANLGEVRNRAGLPVPDGFAVTTVAYRLLLEANDLGSEIAKRTMALAADDPQTIRTVSEDIQRLILTAAIPSAVTDAILDAHRRLAERLGADQERLLVAMRSSAIGEDSEYSFAGQYLSILGVTKDKLLQSYKYVLASLYTSRAIAYRLRKGILDENIAMSVACLRMIDSVASGVMYTRHPVDIRENKVFINGIWGLGQYVVDGIVTPDSFTVAKSVPPALVGTSVSRKDVRLELNPDGSTREAAVEHGLRDVPCLSEMQVLDLAAWGMRLEEHYRSPQDIEWALEDRNGKQHLVILQSRPLARPEEDAAGPELPPVQDAILLIEAGDPAMPGVGAGPVVFVRDEDDLLDFPDGGVLVAAHSSPKFVLIMHKASAIVTDFGSVTGHMASLSREFGVPTLLNAQTATATLVPGRLVTVDAWSGRVYDGQVEELLRANDELGQASGRMQGTFMKDTQVYEVLRRVSDVISPLNLLNPRAPSFTPANCRTLHDVMRYVHEMSYREMFQISDLASGRGGFAVKLKARIPFDLHIIDLGGGIVENPAREKAVTPEEIVSAPLHALLTGMLDPDLHRNEPRPVQLKGFFSVMGEQMLSSPTAGGERFGERSYAIISDKYMNFSSRVGYHYGVVDSYCGKTMNKNYVSFSFKGGAADDTRRNRRARSIALILERLGFSVDTQGDRADARFAKAGQEVIEDKLVLLGRLLQYTRQMDMLMVDEASVELLATCFLSGDYHFEDWRERCMKR